VQTILQAGLPEDVRQVVVLTIGAYWHAPYEIYAHTAAARTAGIGEAAIQAILAGTQPKGLTRAAEVAQRLTTSLLHNHHVPDELYDEIIDRFGEAGTVALLALIGQYQTVSSFLVTFGVPAPTHPEVGGPT
jgi:4-carboxymuconolactone decarboxylase